jgi:hypothetical protein
LNTRNSRKNKEVSYVAVDDVTEENVNQDYADFNYIDIPLDIADDSYISKKELKEFLLNLASLSEDCDENIYLILAVGEIDGYDYDFRFNIMDGEIIRPETFVANLTKNGFMDEDAYWSDEEEKHGANVAVCYDKDNLNEETPILDSILDPDDDEKLVIGGKEYDIIGYQEWTSDGAMIPFNSLSDDVPMQYVTIYYDKYISYETYNKITDLVKKSISDDVEIGTGDTLR